jgi:hypothetical protein
MSANGHGIHGPWRDRSALTGDTLPRTHGNHDGALQLTHLAARKLDKRLSNGGRHNRILDPRSPYDRTNKQAGRRL